MAKEEDFQAVFQRLRSMLQPYQPDLALKADSTENYSLDAAYSEKYQREVFFASAQIKKNYVSYYLMPVYMFPDLLEGLSVRLHKRMQGKSCFNFKTIDETVFAELADLTRRGFARFKAEGLV